MPPPLLFDWDRIDRSKPCHTREEVYELLPHRFEFQVLNGVCLVDRDRSGIVTYADLSPTDWWVRGHVPGRPLLPGVLMLEMAAQSAAVGAKLLGGLEGFIGFGGVDNCKFRETVVPPARMYFLCVGAEHRPRRIISDTQGVVDGRLIFEARITGLILR